MSESYLMKVLKANLNVDSERLAADMAAIVPVAENVPYAAGTNPTKAEFNALVDALIDAGLMAEPENSVG